MQSLRLTQTTTRQQSTSKLLQIPAEICEEIFFPLLNPRDVWSLSSSCSLLRCAVVTSDSYWKSVTLLLPKRITNTVPFYDWCNKESAYSSIATAWKHLYSCLSITQKDSLSPPVSLKKVLQIETKCLGLIFPLELIFSLSIWHNGQQQLYGCQLTEPYFLLSCDAIPIVLQTQRQRGLKKNYLPIFCDSASQKLICTNCTNGEIIVWSMSYEGLGGKNLSHFLEPEDR